MWAVQVREAASIRRLAIVLVALVLCTPLVPASSWSPADGTDDAGPDGQAGAGTWVDPELTDALGGLSDEPQLAVIGLERVADQPIIEELKEMGLDPLAFEHVPVVAALVTHEDVEELALQSWVLSIAANHELETLDAPQVPAWPTAEQSNFGGTGDEMTRADQARQLGLSGEGVGLAVIDLGTSGLHPGLRPEELGGPLVQNVKVLMGRDKVHSDVPSTGQNIYVENVTNTDLSDGHGTHTAGIAVGSWTEDGLLGGRAPGADLTALGTGDALALLWTVAAYDWILEKRDVYDIRITSNSYGRQGPYVPDHPLNLVTEAAHGAGILVVFSAGNNGPGQGTLNMHAQAPHVLAVGASTLSGAIADFSSRGDSVTGKVGPDLVAPGADILSGRNQPLSVNEITARTPWMDAGFVPLEHVYWYRAMSGTSMAAPQVAGIASLVLEADPSLGVDELTDILLSTTSPVLGFSEHAQGHGMVDAEAAVLKAVGEPVPERDWVQPTVVEHDADASVYPFHGALLASPVKGFSAFEHQHPFPVRSPTEGLEVTFSWTSTATAPIIDGLAVGLRGPDGTLVEHDDLDGLGPKGEHTLTLDPSTIDEHAPEGWSAGYWTVEVDMDVGAIEYDVEASVTYEDGQLPDVEHDPAPEPEPLPEREPHEPILIETDEAFTADNGVVAGSGTADDPYLIAGWEIRGGDTNAIKIGGVPGTTAHVVIENVRVSETAGDCIALENAAHVTVQDSSFEACSDEAMLVRGGEDITVQRNSFRASDRGIDSFGASKVLIAENTFRELSTSGVVISQAFTSTGVVTGGTSLDVRILENLFEGSGASLKLVTAAVSGAQVTDNTLLDGSFIELGSGTNLNRISGTDWGGAQPAYERRALTLGHPSAGINTIVDAGSDHVQDADGQVCFTDALVQVAPPDTMQQVVWSFGDGTTASGQTQPCHTYADTEQAYTARVTVVVEEPEGDRLQLSDTAHVLSR